MELKTFLLFSVISLSTGQWVKEMENRGLFEGDMLLSPDQLQEAKNGKLSYATTNKRLWPRTIYYELHESRKNDSNILAAIADYEKYTCLRFKKRTNQRAYMWFVRFEGCYSHVGYNGYTRLISIGDGCTHKGTILHEIAHALGIYHEQSRPDRDDYVTIKWKNIKDGMKDNFRKQNSSNIDSLGTPYDYLSMMHYPDWAFSKNKKLTIMTKDPSMQKVIGQRNGFSEIDKEQINLMYCKNAKSADCTFQRNTCSWVNQLTTANEDSFDWIIASGSTLSASTGPSADRNGNEKGNYLYIEASMKIPGDRARLITKISQDSASGKCFRFFYHMYGSDIGTLNVYVKSAGTERLVWTLSGNKGNHWMNGQVDVGHVTGNYQVIVEGIYGGDYEGDIAIDDFTLRSESCSTVPSDASPVPSSAIAGPSGI